MRLSKLTVTFSALAALSSAAWSSGHSSFLVTAPARPEETLTTFDTHAGQVEVPTTVTVDDHELLSISEAEETMDETIVEELNPSFLTTVE